MRVAAVDIGTNTVRLLIAEAITGNHGVVLEETKRFEIITKLGEGLDATGRLGEAPMERALAGLGRYAELIEQADVGAVAGVATAATRSADNGAGFTRRVAETLGFAPAVIDGVEEARLTFLGATSHLDPNKTYCVIDVGGGSTEFVAGRRLPEYATSVDIGSVRLTERVEALGMRDVDEVRSYVDGLFALVAPPRAPTLVLGSGGTYVTLGAVALGVLPADLEGMGDVGLAMDEVAATVDRLAAMSPTQLAALPAVSEARAGVLRAGVICAERAAAHVSADTVHISVSDILDGIALELGNR